MGNLSHLCDECLQWRFLGVFWGCQGLGGGYGCQNVWLTRHMELATRLELVTCCLQDSCATDCATPA
jgi:hypothetical protein